MNSDNNEMNKLKKKLAILVVITAVFTALGMATSMGGFGDSLVFGFVAGFMFYIPGRLKGILNTGWLGAIILGGIVQCPFCVPDGQNRDICRNHLLYYTAGRHRVQHI